MPSLIGTDIAANYRKFGISQSGVGAEWIVSVAHNAALTEAMLEDVLAYLTMPHGIGDGSTQSDHAFTVGGVGTADGSAIDWTTWTTDPVYVRMQGTGDFTVGTAAAGMSGALANVTVAKVCKFTPAL
jgi:hypothetical protein